MEEDLKKLAHRSGGHSKILHPGKQSQYHAVEGVLRKWLLQRRNRRALVTKRMLIRKVKELSLKLRELTSEQLENWSSRESMCNFSKFGVTVKGEASTPRHSESTLCP